MPDIPTFKPCRAALNWMINSLSDKQIYDLLKNAPALAGEVMRGFKMSTANAGKKIVRKRLANLFQHSHEIFSVILDFEDTPWITWQDVLDMFDEGWFIDNWRTLLRAAKDMNLAVAMAADKRTPIRRRGYMLLARESLWNEPFPCGSEPPPEILAKLRLVTGQTAEPANGKTKDSQALQGKYDKAVSRQHALERETDKLKRALDKQKQKTAAEAAQREKTEINKEENLKKQRSELAQTRSELQTLQDSFQNELDARIRQYRRDALGIDDHVELIEQTLRKTPSAELIEQTRAILTTHRKLNEKFGAISQLRQELESLEEADAQLEECTFESITVLPELHQVKRAVENRIGELKALLPSESGTPEVQRQVRRILKMIRDCTLVNDGLDRLTEIGKMLNSPVFTELIGAENLQMLRRSLNQRRTRLEQISREQELARIETPSGRMDSKTVPYPREIWNLNSALDHMPGGIKPVIYVDGYNVIIGTEPLAGLLKTKGLMAARAELAALFSRVKHRFERIAIVYDGTDALTARDKQDNVVETFAARLEESQNADNYITRQLHSSEVVDNVRWLCTADGGLRTRNRAVCHGIINPCELVLFLRNPD